MWTTARWCLFVALVALGCSGNEPASTPPVSLHEAARTGNLDGVRRALQAGAAIDAKGARGESALLVAINEGHDDIALLLLDRGASVNVQAENLDTPWLQAGALGRTPVIKAMLSKGPDLSIRNRFGGNALIPACERGHVEAVRVLLTSGIDVNHINNLGWTALLEAVVLGRGGPEHQQVVALLLGAGADLKIPDRDGVTALTHARRRGYTAIEALLAGR